MRVKAAVLVAALVLGPAALCTAQIPAPDASTATGETGLFNLLSGDTLPSRAWSFGLYYDNWDRLIDLDANFFPASDDLEMDWDRLSASVGYGITDTWEVALQIPFYDNFQFHHDELLIGQELDASGAGNVRVGTNYQFFRDDTMDSAASINGFVELPTGDSDVASDQHGFGVNLAARLRQFIVNFGYRDPGDDDDFDNPQEIIASGGYARPVTQRLEWITELTGTFVVGGQPDAIDLRNSLDVTSGGRLSFPTGEAPWALNFALRLNLNGLSGVGGVLGVTYGRR